MNINKWIGVLHQENGDVPGWVLVTVMTAGLVGALWLIADGALSSIFSRAIDSIGKP